MKYPSSLNILALDMATTTGFAVLGGGIITSGAVSFKRQKGRKHVPDDHPGIAFIRFQKWLREAIATYKPDRIVFEEPMGNFKNAHARNLIVGFRGILMSTAAYYGVRVDGFAQTKVKMHATGKGNAKKPAMLAAARKRFPGIDIEDDNEADALHVLDLSIRA